MPSDRTKKLLQEKKKKAAAAGALTGKQPGDKSQAPASAGAAATNGGPLDTALQVVFPPTLTARQRAVLHEVAEQAGLAHTSSGEGAHRSIVLGPSDGNKVTIPASGAPISDEELCQLLQQHLSIDAKEQLLHTNSQTRSNAGGTHSNSTTQGAARSKISNSSAASAGAAALQTLEEYVALTTQLLEMEREAEVAQAVDATSLCSPETAQARGRALLNLRLSDAEGGLLGRTLLTLVSNKGFGSGPPCELPQHKFGPHDVVALRPSKGDSSGPPLCSGLVYRVRESSIVVAVDDVPDEGMEQPLRLEKLANEVTYKRLRETLQQLGKPPGQEQRLPGSRLVDVMFGKRPPRFVAAPASWKAKNQGLDESQRRAVSLALSAQDFALVHGPPGTGKTTAVVEIIVQEVMRGNKVLAAAASNIAVDNLVERLAAADPKMRVVRLGHPARLLPQVLENSLEAHVMRSDNSSLAKDCRKDIRRLNGQLMKLEGWKRAERRAIRADLRQLAKEERQRQEKAVQEVVSGAQVLCCTLTGALHHHLNGVTVDVAVVDEAAQALEAATWSALLKAPRAVLAGDHLQLPPTVLSDAAAKRGLARTLFERLQGLHPSASEMLTMQYRMHTAISDWSSGELYQGRLTAHESVAAHTLHDLLPATAPGKGSQAAAARADGDQLPVLLLIDTAGCGYEERQEEEGDSRSNEGEAQAVAAHVQKLVAAGIRPEAIGVITPYSAQVALLRALRAERLSPLLEVSTVDGFQGREKEAIVISMVRSNETGEVGFLADARRMNVAVTRARRHCALVCDTETVGRDAFLGRLVAWFSEHGEYCSAQELVPG